MAVFHAGILRGTCFCSRLFQVSMLMDFSSSQMAAGFHLGHLQKALLPSSSWGQVVFLESCTVVALKPQFLLTPNMFL